MLDSNDRRYQYFQVESDDRPDSNVIWDDHFSGTKPVRQPTRAEKLSIILIGVGAIGFIVLMTVTILVAVYISRR